MGSLIDTGALCSVYPASRHEMNTTDMDPHQLTAANASHLTVLHMAPKTFIYTLPIATTYGHFAFHKSPSLYSELTF